MKQSLLVLLTDAIVTSMTKWEVSIQRQLTDKIEVLFAVHSDLQVPYWSGADTYDQRLDFLHREPAQDVDENGETHRVPLVLTPWTIIRNAWCWTVRAGRAEELRAEPWSVKRAQLACTIAGQPDVALNLRHDSGPPEPTMTTKKLRYTEGHGVCINTVHKLADEDTLRTFQNVFAGKLTPYNPRTHGLLRHDISPDGQRMGDDRLATIEDIKAHQRAIELSRMSLVGRACSRLAHREFDDSHLAYTRDVPGPAPYYL